MSLQRVARFLLWGGLALFIVSIFSCLVGFGEAVESGEGEKAASVGVWMFIVSLLMVLVGAILKAVSSRAGEGR